MMATSGIQGQVLEITVVGAISLKDMGWFSRQYPYVVIEYANNKVRTKKDRSLDFASTRLTCNDEMSKLQQAALSLSDTQAGKVKPESAQAPQTPHAPYPYSQPPVQYPSYAPPQQSYAGFAPPPYAPPAHPPTYPAPPYPSGSGSAYNGAPPPAGYPPASHPGQGYYPPQW